MEALKQLTDKKNRDCSTLPLSKTAGSSLSVQLRGDNVRRSVKNTKNIT